MTALDAPTRSSKYTNSSWCSFKDHSEHCLDFQTIFNQLVQYMTELERHGARTFPSSILSGTDSIGIAVTMRGYIDSQTAGKPSFKNDINEDQAVIDLAALLSSRYPTAVLIIPESASSLNLGPEWDTKMCMIRAVFGSFCIPVISPNMLTTNVEWHSGSLLDGYMKH